MSQNISVTARCSSMEHRRGSLRIPATAGPSLTVSLLLRGLTVKLLQNHNFSILAPEGEYSEITYKIYNQKFPNRCDPNLNHIISYECPQKCSCYYWDDSINNFTLVEMGRDHCTSTLNPVLLSTTTTTT